MSITLEERAAELTGNYLKFDSFARFGSLDSAGNWCIVYTHNRDSRILETCNAEAIAKIMDPFCTGEDDDGNQGDCIAESHNHWACGWIDGYAIRVYDDSGNITPAFAAWHAIQLRLESYPVLNEDAYSQAEHDATMENVEEVVRRVSDKFDLVDVDASDVYQWLSDNRSNSLESRDDQGGYPSDDDVEEALTALGFLEEVEA